MTKVITFSRHFASQMHTNVLCLAAQSQKQKNKLNFSLHKQLVGCLSVSEPTVWLRCKGWTGEQIKAAAAVFEIYSRNNTLQLGLSLNCVNLHSKYYLISVNQWLF